MTFFADLKMCVVCGSYDDTFVMTPIGEMCPECAVEYDDKRQEAYDNDEA